MLHSAPQAVLVAATRRQTYSIIIPPVPAGRLDSRLLAVLDGEHARGLEHLLRRSRRLVVLAFIMTLTLGAIGAIALASGTDPDAFAESDERRGGHHKGSRGFASMSTHVAGLTLLAFAAIVLLVGACTARLRARRTAAVVARSVQVGLGPELLGSHGIHAAVVSLAEVIRDKRLPGHQRALLTTCVKDDGACGCITHCNSQSAAQREGCSGACACPDPLPVLVLWLPTVGWQQGCPPPHPDVADQGQEEDPQVGGCSDVSPAGAPACPPDPGIHAGAVRSTPAWSSSTGRGVHAGPAALPPTHAPPPLHRVPLPPRLQGSGSGAPPPWPRTSRAGAPLLHPPPHAPAVGVVSPLAAVATQHSQALRHEEAGAQDDDPSPEIAP